MTGAQHKYYKLQLASGEFLGGTKTPKGAKRLTVVTAADAAVFLLDAPAKQKKDSIEKYALFMCDGGYLRADSIQKPIATTTAKKGAKSWERFTIQHVPGGYNIISHHGTTLALHDGSIYGSKIASDGLPLTVSFLPAAEPTTGVTRFVQTEIQAAKKRASSFRGSLVHKRSKASPGAANVASVASSPPVQFPDNLDEAWELHERLTAHIRSLGTKTGAERVK